MGIGLMLLPDTTDAAREPVDPVEVLSAGDIRGATPWAAPDGGQLITWNQLAPGSSIRLVERKDGGTFTAPVELATTGGTDRADLSFTPDGGVYAVWGTSAPGTKAQQAIRAPGGVFTPASEVDCRRFVDSAAGPDGSLALSCSWSANPGGPSTVRLATEPGLGPVSTSASDDLIQPVYDNFIEPVVEWGADGTLATAFDQTLSLTSPPPANETTRVRVVLRGPGLNDTADLIQVTEPDRVTLGGLGITPNGTTGVSYSSDAGPVLRVRPPGPAQVYVPFMLPGEETMPPVTDARGNIHVVSVVPDPNRAYYSNEWTTGNPAMQAPVEIPLGGSGDPYIPYEQGFRVAADGTEYALIRADDGVYATSREPGGSAFTAPDRIGPPAESNPVAAVSREGDFMVAWANGQVGDQKLIFGGLDSGKPPAVTVSEFPIRLEDGAVGRFSASAVDSMGIRSTRWDFGDGTTVQGDTAEHAFNRPGDHVVRFIATDRAGNQTVERRTVTVQVGPGSVPQLKLKTPKRIRFKVLKRRGLRVVLTARPAVRVRAVIGTSKRNARLRPMRTVVVKRLRGRHVLRIKPKRNRLGKRRAFRLYLQVRGTTAAGRQTTKARTVRVRR